MRHRTLKHLNDSFDLDRGCSPFQRNGRMWPPEGGGRLAQDETRVLQQRVADAQLQRHRPLLCPHQGLSWWRTSVDSFPSQTQLLRAGADSRSGNQGRRGRGPRSGTHHQQLPALQLPGDGALLPVPLLVLNQHAVDEVAHGLRKQSAPLGPGPPASAPFRLRLSGPNASPAVTIHNPAGACPSQGTLGLSRVPSASAPNPKLRSGPGPNLLKLSS